MNSLLALMIICLHYKNVVLFFRHFHFFQINESKMGKDKNGKAHDLSKSDEFAPRTERKCNENIFTKLLKDK